MIISERAEALKWIKGRENEEEKPRGKILQRKYDRIEVTMLSDGG